MNATRNEAVRLKSREDFNRLKDRENAVEAHEPYNLIVFKNEKDQKHNPDKVKKVSEVGDTIPTGLALCYPVDRLEARAWLERNGYNIAKRLPQLYAVEIPFNMTFEQFYQMCMNSGRFTHIEPDGIREMEPQINYSNSNDYLNYAAWPFKTMEILEAMALVEDKVHGVIGIMDLHGAQVDHLDMVGQYAYVRNCTNGTTDILPRVPGERHGDPCAGIPCATYNNGQGAPGRSCGRLQVAFAKIGWNIQSSGSASVSSLAYEDACAWYETIPNLLSLSMSFGSTAYNTTFYNALTRLRNNARGGKGILIFGSAGNSGMKNKLNYPGTFPGIINVGASTINNTKPTYGNYGSVLTLAAPAGGPTIDKKTDQYGAGYRTGPNPLTDLNNPAFSGTSCASPEAATVGAMMAAANPDATKEQLYDALIQSCVHPAHYNIVDGKSEELGYGVVNMHKAVLLIQGAQAPIPRHNFTCSISTLPEVLVGQSINISMTGKTSRGDLAAINIPFRLYWSLNNTLSADDVPIGEGTFALGGNNAISLREATYKIPAGYGNRFVIVKIDPEGTYAESNENDNIGVTMVTVKMPLAPEGSDVSFIVDHSNPDKKKWIGVALRQPDGRVFVRFQFKNTGNLPVRSYKMVKGFNSASLSGSVTTLPTAILPNSVSQLNQVAMYPPVGATEVILRFTELNGNAYVKELKIPIE